MTKRRAPLSVEQALARIAGLLPDGFDEMACVTARSASLVRKWGDPDREEQIPVDCAIALDLAYRAAGGGGYPLYDAIGYRLELAEAAAFGSRFSLLRHARAVIKEGGEAHAALIRACEPDAAPADEAAALRELADALEAIKKAMAALDPPTHPARPPPH